VRSSGTANRGTNGMSLDFGVRVLHYYVVDEASTHEEKKMSRCCCS